MRYTADPADSLRDGLSVLAQHHHELRARFRDLVAKAREGDSAALRGEWAAFEGEMLRHLELEETRILPAFAERYPAEARALLAEHSDIRGGLLEMGLNLDLHLLRAEAVEAFVRRIEAHAEREDAALYGWARHRLTPEEWRSIERGLHDTRAA